MVDNTMGKNIETRFIEFFLKIHYVALFYAFFVVPLAILGGSLGAFLTGPFVSLALLVPLGPISISVYGMHFLFSLFSQYNNLFWAITVAIIIKFITYVFLRRSKLLNYSIILVLLIIALTTCVLSTLARGNLIAFSYGLLLTVSMDLVVFSYVKFRDATNGIASRKWIPILTILWSLMIWISIITNTGVWLNWLRTMFNPISPTIIIDIWIIITVVQVLFSIKYYYVTK